MPYTHILLEDLKISDLLCITYLKESHLQTERLTNKFVKGQAIFNPCKGSIQLTNTEIWMKR